MALSPPPLSISRQIGGGEERSDGQSVEKLTDCPQNDLLNATFILHEWNNGLFLVRLQFPVPVLY